MNLSNLYTRYPVLKKVNDRYDGIIERNIVRRKLLAKESLRRFGDSCMGFTFIIEGEIKIEKINEDGKETALYNLKPGEICHEALSCMLECIPLNINAEAIQDSTVYVLSLDVAEKYLLSDIDFMQYLYKNLYNKVKLLIDDKEKIIHEPLEKRLLDLLRSKNSRIIYSTHEEIAIQLGTSREVITRKLKKLEKEGIVKPERGKIYLLK